ncbi:lysylphosphatidylglycerol synthase transmembrane domain-containing protein, partial [[Clostridium] dakarense]|uniref:lysylphosphatidylglycerol synthase transmembrane domain-containing protein n=1 Tax=Faecalimicrobium dakarense TaxID=1301100 RepID=UPI0005A613C7
MRKITKKQKAFIQYAFLLFLICLTTYLVSTTLDIALIPHILKVVDVKYIIAGVLLVAIYILFEAYILQLVINSIEKTKVRFLGFKIGTMGLYYNLVTPFASGSQPIQIYALTKYGISLSKSVAIITNKTIVFQTVVTTYCGYLIFLNLDLLKTEMPSIMMLVTAGMIMNIVMLVGGILIVLSPNKIKMITSYILDKLSRFKFFKKLADKKEKINEYIDEYNYSIKIFIKDKKNLVLSLILTTIQLTIFFSVTYCIYKAFNLNGLSYWHILTLQVFLYMAVSPIPTPGNVGANELAFFSIFANVFPKEIIGYSVFLHSGFAYYMLVIVAGIFTINTHHNMNKYGNEKIYAEN